MAACLYFLLAVVAIFLSRRTGSVGMLWYANAMAVALLQTKSAKDWPALLVALAIGHLAAGRVFDDPLRLTLSCITGNTLEIVLGSLLLRRYCVPAQCVSHAGAVLKALLLGGVVPAVFGAALGAGLLSAFDLGDFEALWVSWFEGSSIGGVSILPLGLLLVARGWRPLGQELRRPAVVASLALVVGISMLAPPALPHPYVYISIALVLVASIGRFSGAAAGVLLCSLSVGVLIAAGSFQPLMVIRPVNEALFYLPLLLVLLPPLLLAATFERIQQGVIDLARREDDFRTLYQHTPVMMHSVDIHKRLVSVNDAWLARLGFERSEVLGRLSTEFLTPDSRRRAEESVIPRFVSEGFLRDVDYQMVTKGGDVLDVRLSAIWQRDAQGRPLRTLSVLQETTEQNRLAAELADEKERIEVTLHSIGDGVVTTDEEGCVTYMNPVAEQLVGHRLADVKGLAFGHVVHLFNQATDIRLPGPIDHCLHDQPFVGVPQHAVLRDREGREYGVQYSVAPIVGKNGLLIGAVMVFQDVTEARALSQKLAHLAHHDSLTELPNRVLFQDRVRQACQFGHRQRNRSRFAVVFMDLDHFKHVNDSLGHAVGDQLLQTIARRLSGALRSSDTVCRLGGDEFVMLVSEIESPDDVGDVAKKVLREVAVPCVLGSTEVSVGISLGISIFPDDGEDPETLMKHADAAMYRSKREGRNRYQFFSKSVDQAAAARLTLEADMRRGLAEGQFVAHFQPIIDAITGQPVALEALARWDRPEHGLQGPFVFIPVAEESGLIVPLGVEMLRQACDLLRAWRDSALDPLTIAVNVSPVQLADIRFVDTVSEILRSSGVTGAQLAFEITESTLMKDPAATLEVLRQIKALGIRIAVDDFGTGYSSLSHLKRYPVDSVKIDRSFVRDLETDPDDRELARAIVAMSRSLRLRVVAEGVETEAQASMLGAMGCTSLQGFLYAKPLDAVTVTAWLRSRLEAHPANEEATWIV